MTNVLLRIPIVLSFVLLGAHFVRYGNYVGLAGVVVLLALTFVRHPIAARVLQLSLILGAVEWGYTLHRLAQFRAAMDLPSTRMVIILGAVTALTFCSALLIETRPLRTAYRLKR
jgi:hypothetical protein